MTQKYRKIIKSGMKEDSLYSPIKKLTPIRIIIYPFRLVCFGLMHLCLYPIYLFLSLMEYSQKRTVHWEKIKDTQK